MLTSARGKERAINAAHRHPSQRLWSNPIEATVLGKDDGGIFCPLVARIGLDFGDEDPLAVVAELLAAEGLTDPEDLRSRLDIPSTPLICREDFNPKPLTVRRDARPDQRIIILRQVLILGLSTAYYYEPSRPVLLTRTSLLRCLELFDGKEFYA